MTTSLRRLTAFVLFALVTVEFGGWSLLGLLTSRGALTPFQEQFFRAGHGHAGALLLGAALIGLGVGILRAGRATPTSVPN